MQEAASLVGAPDDAQVSLRASASGNVWVKVSHPAFDAVRVFAFDEKTGEIYIRNEEFWVKKDKQGAGIGAEVFGRQVENAAALGVTKIRCHAAKENPRDPQNPHNGYYTWPRFGYDQPLDAFDESEAAELRLKKAIRKNFPEARSVLDVMATPAGREWWKKNGDDLQVAAFDLAENSRSRRIFDAYLQERASRAGAAKYYAFYLIKSESPHVEEIDLSADDERWLDAAWSRLDAENAAIARGNDKAFDESKHPRGQAENAGEFAAAAGGGAVAKPKHEIDDKIKESLARAEKHPALHAAVSVLADAARSASASDGRDLGKFLNPSLGKKAATQSIAAAVAQQLASVEETATELFGRRARPIARELRRLYGKQFTRELGTGVESALDDARSEIKSDDTSYALDVLAERLDDMDEETLRFAFLDSFGTPEEFASEFGASIYDNGWPHVADPENDAEVDAALKKAEEAAAKLYIVLKLALLGGIAMERDGVKGFDESKHPRGHAGNPGQFAVAPESRSAAGRPQPDKPSSSEPGRRG